MTDDKKQGECEAKVGAVPMLSAEAWRAATDPDVLLRHAVRLIAPRHLTLVLAELAAGAWRRWNHRFPEDWRVALCIGTLRAWCFGEASYAEVRAARTAAWEIQNNFSRWPRVPGFENMPALGASKAAALATSYVLENDATSEVVGDRLLPRAAIKTVQQAIHWTSDDADVRATQKKRDELTAPGSTATFAQQLAAEEAHDAADRYQTTLRNLEAAETIRRLIPYTTIRATKWEVTGDTVQTGNAVLEIVDQCLVGATHPSGRHYVRAWN